MHILNTVEVSSHCHRILAIEVLLNATKLATDSNGALLLNWFLDNSASFPNRFALLSSRFIPSISFLCSHPLSRSILLKIINQREDPWASHTLLNAISSNKKRGLLLLRKRKSISWNRGCIAPTMSTRDGSQVRQMVRTFQPLATPAYYHSRTMSLDLPSSSDDSSLHPQWRADLPNQYHYQQSSGKYDEGTVQVADLVLAEGEQRRITEEW